MEAHPEADRVPAAPPLEGRRTLRFDDVSEVVEELEQENDQLREEVERLMSRQGSRRPSQGSRRPSLDCLEDGPRQRWSRAVSAVSRRGSIASAEQSTAPGEVSRRSSRKSIHCSPELDGQLDAALVENHELSDRLRDLERQRQLDAEARAGQEAAVAELTARVRQLEQENLELEARNEELAAVAESGDSLEGVDEGSDGGALSRRGTQRSLPRQSTRRSSCRMSSAACRHPEAELRPSLLRAQSQTAELEAELEEARLEHQQLLGRTHRLEAECEELGLLLEQQRKATDHSRREAEALQAELAPLRRAPCGGAQGWSLLRQLVHAADPGAEGQDGGTCAECLSAEGRPGRREECGQRGSTGSTGSSGNEASGHAELLSLQQECQRLREEEAEARADARRVPELLSDIIGLQDELAAAQATTRELESQQARPDLFTRWFDSIACAGARPPPGSATMPAPPS